MVRNTIISIFVLLVVFTTNGQFSFNGGASMLKGFSPGKAYAGFHLGIEIPRDDAVTFFGRYSHYFASKERDSSQIQLSPRDINNFPPGMQMYPVINGNYTMNYNIFEGGTRYYLGNGYDFGFGAYGGSTLMLVFNKVRLKTDPYSEEYYTIDPLYNYSEGSIFGFGFGLQGGVKYTRPPMGTFYLDAGITYMLFAQGSVDGVYPDMYNALFFTVNVGYRRDIFR